MNTFGSPEPTDSASEQTMLQAPEDLFMTANQSADDVIQSWCRKELTYWQSKRLDAAAAFEEMQRRNDTRPMEFLFLIRGGEVSMAPKAPETPDRVPVWRPPLYLKFLREVVRRFCPDLEVDLLVNVNDGHLTKEPIPIFSFQKPLGANVILLPDVDFLEFNFYYGNERYKDTCSFAEKTCSAVFVGSTTGAVLNHEAVAKLTHPRLRSAVHFKENPKVDFRLPTLTTSDDDVKQMLLGMGFGQGDRLSFLEQFKHKFLISMDGWGATCSRLPIAFRSNSVLLKYDSPHQLYYFSSLVPWLHYIPISIDEDVNAVIRIEEEAPGSFAGISRAANEFADRYLTRLQAMKYTAWLLKAYADSFSRPASASSTRRTELQTVGPEVPASTSDAERALLQRPSVEIMAHISSIGDVWFSASEWAGTAGHDAFIEGFTLEPGPGVRPSELEYRSLAVTGEWSQWSTGGMFCGTQRRRQPLLGVAIRTAGQLARYWDCEYVARFADGSQTGPVRQGALCRAKSGAALRSLHVRLVLRNRPQSAPMSRASDTASIVRDPAALPRLLMKFESLGGTGHGCEFGLAQRSYGAEPLGLLRWADLSHEQLAAALERRFDGVGEVANTVVFSPDHAKDEYWTRDKRYHMAMRTFVKVADVPYERMVERVCRRLQFLRAKLIEDLTDGDKIFVYKNMYRNLTQLELDRLQAAVRAYGRNILLYIAYANDSQRHGTVEHRRAGLLVGYVDRFAFSPSDRYLGPSHDLLADVCLSASRIVEEADCR